MILHYLKVAVRSLMKYKMQTAISIVGLAVGFVCLAFSMIWIRYELTYDDFHRGVERMYVLCAKSGLELDGITTSMTFPLAKDLKRIFPEVEEAAAFSHWKVPVGKDREERIVTVPDDLKERFAAEPGAAERFDALSYTNRKEFVRWIEDAKRAETRSDRLRKTILLLSQGRKNPSDKG